MKHSGFVHLHVHSEYSLLDGACRIADIVGKAREYKMPAVAITDHGNLFGAIEFYAQAIESGVKPIIGYEAYLAPGSRFEKTSKGSAREFLSHLTILVKNETGYRNLIKLATAAYLEGLYYKPRIDKELLSRFSEGLIVLSGCLKGGIPDLIRRGEVPQAEESAVGYREMLGEGNFYLEMQDAGIKDQREVNEGLLEISKRTGIPVVATNDCHYIERGDAYAHGILLCIQTGTTVNDPSRMQFTGDEFYFRSAEEMEKLFSNVPGALSNTIEIAEKCNLELDFGKTFLPKFDVPDKKKAGDYLKELCREGFSKRFDGENKEASERLKHELSVIKELGFSSYFLIVWDVVKFAKENSIPVGPGRGSAAGSIAAYVLGITDVDPLRYGLLFERFLNSERAKLPDIDIDFSDEDRGRVIEYVRGKYGTDRVAQIVTFGTMAARAVIRDVGRALDMPYGEVDRIAKLVPEGPGKELKSAIREEPRLKEISENTESGGKKLLDTALSLEGLTRHASVHAAGMVIADKGLSERVPLFKTGEDEITQYPMESLEKVGILKMDFLGLKTLSVIKRTLTDIEKVHNKKIVIEDVPLDDSKTFELMQEGDTLGVFQLESSGMRDLLRKLQPEKIEDIIAVLALYRPGPLGSGMITDFIERKHGRSPIEFDHPALEPVLGDTHGIILYQEQIMKVVNVLAGFSLEQADDLQKSISKKIPEVMERQRELFIKGASKKHIEKKIADRVFDNVAHFAGYGFNKAHSTGYAMVAYWTAYLKANYLKEFFASLLSNEMGNTDKLVTYINECGSVGIKVLPPDVNESRRRFMVTRDGIRFGLGGVKNIGAHAIESIVNTRDREGKFTSLFDFCERVDLRLVNKRVLESLIKCGAFDCFKVGRSRLAAAVDDASALGQRKQKDRLAGQISLFGNESKSREYPDVPEWHESQLLNFEKEVAGFYISGHPLGRYEALVKTYSSADTGQLREMKNGTEVALGGIITSVRRITTKKGNQMGFIGLEDLQGNCELSLFPKVFGDYESLLKQDALIYIRGQVDWRQDEAKVVVREVMPLNEVEKRLAGSAHIKLITAGLEEDLLLSLREILLSHPGECKVYIHLESSICGEVVLGGNSGLTVEPGSELVSEVEKLVGEKSIYLTP